MHYMLDVKFGRLKQARERLEKAVRLDPEDLETQYSYVRVLAASGDAKAFAEQNQRAKRLRSDQNQIEELRKQLAGEPDNLEIRSEVAQWLIEHNHEEDGLDWARRILAVKPDHPATWPTTTPEKTTLAWRTITEWSSANPTANRRSDRSRRPSDDVGPATAPRSPK